MPPTGKAVKAGRGFIVKHMGDWFRVPKRLVKNGRVDMDEFAKHLEMKNPGGKMKKPQRRDLFMGKTPNHRSPTGRQVKDRMKREGTYRSRKQGRKEIEEIEYPKGSDQWHNVNDCDMAHKHDAVKFWNDGGPEPYTKPGRESGPRSEYVRDFMKDPDMYELRPKGPNRSDGARLGQTYKDPT